MSAAPLEACELSVTLGRAQVVRDISATIERGE